MENLVATANTVVGKTYPNLGFGIGLRVPHYDTILSQNPEMDFFEIISENFMVDGGKSHYILDQILEKYTIVQHGVSMYAGNAEGLNFDYLKRLKKLIKKTKTPWLSDHLCWGSLGGTYSHDLLPMPYTSEAVNVISQNLRMAQDFLEIPLVVENVSSYATFKSSVMTEWDFVGQVLENAKVGLLLDVNNIYVSSVNHEFDPYSYINAIDPVRVAQIHIAGHSRYQRYIIDTHDHPVIDPVWELYIAAIKKCGRKSTLLEWDDNIPSFSDVHAEVLKGKSRLEEAGL